MLGPAQLEHVWLSRVDFAENVDFDTDEHEKLYYDLSHDTTVESVHDHADGGETHGVLRLDLEVEWYRLDDDSPATGPFSIALALRGIFVWPEQVSDEGLARRWLDFNGRYLLWPYARSHIASITVMSRFPALTIYTMEVPDAPDFESDENVLAEATEE